MALEAEKPAPGIALELAPGIRRVLAPNPGPMTHWGTNSYVLGRTDAAVIDPGPDDARHRAALLAAVAGARVHAVLVTHAHRDHSAGARAFAADVGAPVLAFGPPEAGRSPVMSRLAASGRFGGGGEGVDTDFRPDGVLDDGRRIDFGEGALEVVHCPGHFGGHLAFALGDILFSGDHVMDWATTLISPPDGDVADFLASCARLRARADRLCLPGHGPPVTDPAARLDWLVAHRAEREAEVLAALTHGPARAGDVTRAIYRDIPPGLLPAASRNVLAHLVDLHERGRIVASPAPADDAFWQLAV